MLRGGRKRRRHPGGYRVVQTVISRLIMQVSAGRRDHCLSTALARRAIGYDDQFAVAVYARISDEAT
jgi:hypothetical protein